MANRSKIKSIIIRMLNNFVEFKNKLKFMFSISHKKYIMKRFREQHGYNINFKDPITYSEKIQWLKIYGSLQKYSTYADKYTVRDYVKERIGEKYLVPKIGVYEHVDQINVNLLPNKFIIKATHGSGWNMIVNDKSKLDWSAAKKKIQKWINTNYFYISGEKNYKDIKGRVIIEQLIEGNVKEYKFFCFHGQPKYLAVITVTDSNKREKVFYDVNWNRLDMTIGLPNTSSGGDKPDHYDEMLEICNRLSSNFPFVRVDLYYSQGNIYFGELTFTPNNGFNKFSDVKFDELFGEHLNLSKVKT